MIDASVSEQLRDALMREAGGFLANPIRQPNVTCEVCAAPIDDQYSVCAACISASRGAYGHELADLVGSSTYAKPQHQTGYMMHGYKATSPQQQHQTVVQLLLADALLTHRECAEALGGVPISAWASVPSLTKKRTSHPLRGLVTPMLTGTPEIEITATEKWTTQRQVTPTNFTIDAQPDGEHVLVVDDTWTTGAQSQSVAAGLKAAGASRVTIYTVARWLDENWPPTKAFLAARKKMVPKPKFDANVCP